MKWVFLFYLIALNTICAKGIFLGRKAILCLTLLFGFCIWFFYFASLRRLFNWFFRLWPSREYFAWFFNIASNGHFFTNFHHFPIRLEFSSGFLVHTTSNQKDSTGKKFSQAKYKSNAVPHSEEEVRKKTLKAHIGHTPLPNQLGNYNIIHFICCNNICFSFGSFCYSGLILILHSFAFKSIGCCLFCSSSSRID